ncbi:small VCP/p97-interacting protein isoform X1 [Aquarana catesbeiana]|uniref:small VCP/p97-interacting protein isoform X1 n=1 Tax=Aquarana catesbeiana TaxID=8400 RepID=UPI003CCA6159
MGMCLPCLGGAAEDVIETPDPVGPILSQGTVLEDFPETPIPELKRRQLAEAAEKRQMETVNRGIKNPISVEQKKKKKEEVEKMTSEAAPAGGGGGGGLRWQVG